jgi:mxaK protein
MKRRHVHIAFGVTAAAFAVIAVYEGVHLRSAKQVNAAIISANVSSDSVAFPEARLAHAIALAASGEYEGALRAYKILSRDAPDKIASAALFNAGNLQLREAMKEGPAAAARAFPLIELSKQSYRSVLRRNPQDWDARYNLERALWLAPEVEEEQVERVRRDAENRVMSTLQNTRAELP